MTLTKTEARTIAFLVTISIGIVCALVSQALLLYGMTRGRDPTPYLIVSAIIGGISSLAIVGAADLYDLV